MLRIELIYSVRSSGSKHIAVHINVIFPPEIEQNYWYYFLIEEIELIFFHRYNWSSTKASTQLYLFAFRRFNTCRPTNLTSFRNSLEVTQPTKGAFLNTTNWLPDTDMARGSLAVLWGVLETSSEVFALQPYVSFLLSFFIFVALQQCRPPGDHERIYFISQA